MADCLERGRLLRGYIPAAARSFAAILLAGLLEVHSWLAAVPVRGAQDLMSVAPTYECDFGELSAWLLAGCLAAPLVAFPFTVTSALRVTNTVVVGFPLGFGLPLTVHLSTTTRLLR